MHIHMPQQLANEVERQGQGKQVNYTQDSSFFWNKRRRAALGGIRTHDTLQSGEGSTNWATRETLLVEVRIYNTTQHNTTQGKPQTTAPWYTLTCLNVHRQSIKVAATYVQSIDTMGRGNYLQKWMAFLHFWQFVWPSHFGSCCNLRRSDKVASCMACLKVWAV